MFNPHSYANSKSIGVAVLQIVPAPAKEQRRAEPELSLLFVPLKRTAVNGRWDGPLAEITVTHTYGYTRAQLDAVIEAIYRFPMPGDAAVRKVVVSFGDVEIAADLKEREEAQKAYDDAVQHEYQAALVTRESPDVFTLRVAGLKPDEDVVVETTYVQLARPDGAGWTIRIPLTVAPRYVRPDEAGTPASLGQRLAVARDPGHRFSLDLLSAVPGTIASSTHALDASDEDGSTRVRLRGVETTPDRDCVLTWRPEQESTMPTLHVLLGEDPTAGHTYFLALVSPPALRDRSQTAVPREAIILVDHSGSMGGPKWAAADWATTRFLNDLTQCDSFNLGVFHNTTTWVHRSPARATPAELSAAEAFLKSHTDSGGTELGVALEQALSQRKQPGEASRQVVVVTDAQVSDADRILALVRAEAKAADRRRVSVLCVDAAPNSYLTNEIARIGGGIARYLTSSPEEGDVTTALDDILSGWVQPVLTGLRLEVNRRSLEAPESRVVSDPETGLAAVDLGDLTAGRSIWVAGRVPTNGEPRLTFRLVGYGEKAVEAHETRTKAARSGAIKALFGAWKVLGLETLQSQGHYGVDVREGLAALGYDANAVLMPRAGERKSMYAENQEADVPRRLRELLVRESLEYGLLCSATGFVAVRKQAGKQIEATAVVPNALAAGWDEGFATTGAAALMMPSAMAGPQGPGVTSGYSSASIQAAYQFRVGEPDPLAGDVDSEDASKSGIVRRLTRGWMAQPPRSPQPVSPQPVRSPRDAQRPGGIPLFAGPLPAPADGRIILFDSARKPDAQKLAGLGRLSALRFRFDGGVPSDLDETAQLLLYVGDLAEPVARVRLVDILRQGGRRPINVALPAGARVMLVMVVGDAAWARMGVRVEAAVE